MSTHHSGRHSSRHQAGHEHQPHYRHLMIMMSLSFISMYVLIRTLCRNIISGQQAEIDQMRANLHELER